MFPNFFRIRFFLMCLFLGGTAVLTCAQSNNTKHDKVRLQLKWLNQFQFAGYYAAVEKGFYADEGLEVEIIEGQPELDPADAVLSGDAEYGVGTPELMLSYAEGEPLVVLGVIFQHSPYVFLTTENNEIPDITALVNKRVMIEPQAAELYAYLAREHVPVKSLKILPHSFSPEDLLNGTVDVMSAYSTDEVFTLEAKNIPYLTFSPRSGGIDFYGDVFFTTQDELKQHPERVRAFYNATIKGWQYAMKHPDEIIEIIQKKYPSEKSTDALKFEFEEMRDLMHPEIIPVGYMYEGRWLHIMETYRELGMLDSLPELDDFLYVQNPKPNYTWALWLSGGTLGLAALAFAFLLPLWRLNNKLKLEIEKQQKTENLLYEAKAAADRANASKSNFLTSVTHDLRTPLNAILGISELMLDEENDVTKGEHLRIIRDSGKSLLSLVSELSDLNKMESGRIELLLEPFLIDDVIDAVTELMSVPAHRKGIELVSWIEPGLKGSVRGDIERVRQLLFNLVGNAVKFTDHGHIILSAAKEGKNMLSIRVEDSGPGIPEDQHTKIFEPFARTEQTMRKEGSGLGLSIVKRLAEAMGGTAESIQTKAGACFIVRLPIIDDNALSHATDLSESYDGAVIGVSLKSELQTKSAIKNLQSLGARAEVLVSNRMNDYEYIVLDTETSSGMPLGHSHVIRLNNLRALATRRTLARQLKRINR